MAVTGEGSRPRLMPEAGAGPCLPGREYARAAGGQTGMFLCASSKASCCSALASVWYFSFHSENGIP